MGSVQVNQSIVLHPRFSYKALFIENPFLSIMAKIVFLIATVVILFASIELGVSEVKCGGHYASSCSSCPQGNGESWCNGDCTWRSGRCVSKSSSGGGRSISGRSTPPAPNLYTSCSDKQKAKYQTLQSAWDDCVKDSSCTGVIDYDCDNDNYRLCYGQPRPSSSDTCIYRNSGKSSSSESSGSTNYATIALSKHNHYRRLHGSPPLSLDNMLSFGAQKHAERLAAKGNWLSNSDHDQYRGNVGENMGISCSSASHPSYDEVTDEWYAEERLYDYYAGMGSPDTGHFTQVVWRSSTKLGIGIGKGKVDNMFCTWIVGRYSPAGNVQGHYRENVMRPSK